MNIRHDFIRVFPLVIMSVFFAWCVFNLFFGAGNVFSLGQMQAEEAQLSAHLDEMRTKRETIESQVVRVRPDTLDWDLIDEQAIKLLGDMPESGKALNM